MLAPSPDGAALAVSHGETTRLKVFELDSDGRVSGLVGYFKDGEACLALDWQPVGFGLALGHADGRVRRIGPPTDGGRALTQVEIWEAHVGIIRAVRYSHDGEMLYTAGDDGTVAAWTADGKLLWRHELGR